LSNSDFPSLVDTFAPALRRLQRVSGVSSEFLLQRVAEALGQELAKAMTSSSLDGVLDELGVLFSSLGLGNVTFQQIAPKVTLTINECLGCEQIPDAVLETNCALRERMLKAIFDERLGVDSRVKFLSSQGSEFGRKTCRFTVTLEESK